MDTKLNSKKWYKIICWAGKCEKVPCDNHTYAWSGKMPCTGILKCVHCGKPKEKK